MLVAAAAAVFLAVYSMMQNTLPAIPVAFANASHIQQHESCAMKQTTAALQLALQLLTPPMLVELAALPQGAGGCSY